MGDSESELRTEVIIHASRNVSTADGVLMEGFMPEFDAVDGYKCLT